MKKFLVVVDIQKDFVNGSLGTAEAERIVPRAAEKIREFDGEIFVTYDTHSEDYLNTAEGTRLPVPHCIEGTEGWELDGRIADALSGKEYKIVRKPTFGSMKLPGLIREVAGDEDLTVELIGLCTDICVISNALILKASFYESDIAVDVSCCAGVTPETHRAAIDAMKMCQISITEE